MDNKWKKIGEEGTGESEFFKWERQGQEIEGIWKGKTDGKFGPIGWVEDEQDSSQRSFPLHTVLLNKLEDVGEGTLIRIEYLGKKSGKNGREYKNFNVYTSDTSNDAREGA